MVKIPTKKVTLLRRFGAIFYDGLLVFSLMLVLGFLVTIILPVNNNNQANPYFFFIVTLPVSFFYFAFFWMKSGQTLGMRTWHIRLVNANQYNKTITLTQCFMRYILTIISWLSLGLGFFYQWLDKDKQTFHDKYSKTQLEMV